VTKPLRTSVSTALLTADLLVWLAFARALTDALPLRMRRRTWNCSSVIWNFSTAMRRIWLRV
jgi:hypothetical protein